MGQTPAAAYSAVQNLMPERPDFALGAQVCFDAFGQAASRTEVERISGQ
jgi:hypothetical protein